MLTGQVPIQRKPASILCPSTNQKHRHSTTFVYACFYCVLVYRDCIIYGPHSCIPGQVILPRLPLYAWVLSSVYCYENQPVRAMITDMTTAITFFRHFMPHSILPLPPFTSTRCVAPQTRVQINKGGRTEQQALSRCPSREEATKPSISILQYMYTMAREFP